MDQQSLQEPEIPVYLSLLGILENRCNTMRDRKFMGRLDTLEPLWISKHTNDYPLKRFVKYGIDSHHLTAQTEKERITRIGLAPEGWNYLIAERERQKQPKPPVKPTRPIPASSRPAQPIRPYPEPDSPDSGAHRLEM